MVPLFYGAIIFTEKIDGIENMIDWNTYRMTEWNKTLGEDEDYAKKAILAILKDQQVSLSKTRVLFNHILEEIKDNNTVIISLEEHSYNICLNADEQKKYVSPSELIKLNNPKDYLVYHMPSYQPSEEEKKNLISVELS